MDGKGLFTVVGLSFIGAYVIVEAYNAGKRDGGTDAELVPSPLPEDEDKDSE